MTAFDDMSSAFASFLGIDVVTAGFLLGFIVIILLTIALVWLLGDNVVGRIGLLLVSAMVMFVTLVGWWPIWSVVFIIVILMFVILNPFEEGRSSGG